MKEITVKSSEIILDGINNKIGESTQEEKNFLIFDNLENYTDDEITFEYIYTKNLFFGMDYSYLVKLFDNETNSRIKRIIKKGIDFYKKNKHILRCGVLKEYITIYNKKDEDITVNYNGVKSKAPSAYGSVYSYDGKNFFMGYNLTSNDKTFNIDGKEIIVSPRVLIYEEL